VARVALIGGYPNPLPIDSVQPATLNGNFRILANGSGKTFIENYIGVNNPSIADRPVSIRGYYAASEWMSFYTASDVLKWYINEGGGFNIGENGGSDYILFLNYGGNVTIGGNENTEKLRVNGTLRATDNVYFEKFLGINNVSPSRPLTIKGNSSLNEWIGFVNTSGVTKWNINGDTTSDFQIAETGIAYRFIIKQGGDIGIGNNASSGYKVDITGTTRSTDYISDNPKSDKRMFLDVGTSTSNMTTVRGSVGNWYLDNMAIAGTWYASWTLNDIYRTTANKGIRINAVTVGYYVITSAISSPTINLVKQTITDGFIPTYVSTPLTGTFTTTTGGTSIFYKRFTVPSPTYINTANIKVTLELSFVTTGTGTIRLTTCNVEYDFNSL
jgi:hypothetical protein